MNDNNSNPRTHPNEFNSHNNILLYSNQKEPHSNLPKPDLSPLIQKEYTFELKTHGSYKKPKVLFPESPMKSPNQKYFTPGKITGKNLFGSLDSQNVFRKLNFDAEPKDSCPPKKTFVDLLENVEEKDEDYSSPLQQKDDSNHLNNQSSSFHSNDKESSIKESRLDSEFQIIKRIAYSKHSSVFIARRKNDNNNIITIKHSSRMSIKNNYATIQKLFIDFNNNITSPYSKFCAIIKDYWLEDDDLTEILVNQNNNTSDSMIIEDSSDIRIPNKEQKHLFIRTDYYSNGDLLDYLSKQERENFAFTPDFYWDIIFEMLCGVLFINECGYLHLDIKPANFLVDAQGYVHIGDFGLSQKIKDLNSLHDIYEGDSIYIAPEVFYRSSIKDLNKSGDVFSLGLSILEIMAKIELPKNGALWREIRNPGFTMPNEFLVNWNIKDKLPFINLIQKMICNHTDRWDISKLLGDIHHFPQLTKRFQMIQNNTYIKSSKITTIPNLMLTNNMNPSFNIGIQTPKQSINGFKF